MYKISRSQTPSCSIAQRSNFSNTALVIVKYSPTWTIDLGATNNMNGDSSLFSSYNPCAGNHKMKMAYVSLSAVAGRGSIILSPLLTLKNVLHVPKLSCNLISITKLIKDINCQYQMKKGHFITTWMY